MEDQLNYPPESPDGKITYRKDYILESDVISEVNESIYNMIVRSYNEALREGIKANSIVINKNMVKVDSFSTHVHNIPPMICGLNVYFTKDELPENYSFAIMEGRPSRLEQFESIGMEPDELRKAADIYRKIKETL